MTCLAGLAILTLVATVGACQSLPAESSSATDSAQQQSHRQAVAERFVAALNSGDVNGLVALSGEPFLYRVQQWETSKSGAGFELGPARDQVFSDRAERAAFLHNLPRTVQIASPTAAANPPAKTALLANQLKGADEKWQPLEIFVFLRGSADVEHIALVGVDRASRIVKALYVN